MTYEEAISKAAKLLRLSKSSNPNEAALAASKAQEIIERFKLDAGMLEYDTPDQKPDEPIKDFWFDPLDSAGGSWRWRLTHALAQQNQCKGYVISKGRPCLIGRPSDVQTVRYLYAWLVSEIEQLTRKDCAGCGRNYANNFRLGVVETVTERLEAGRKETHAAMKAEAAQGFSPSWRRVQSNRPASWSHRGRVHQHPTNARQHRSLDPHACPSQRAVVSGQSRTL